ncbi:MAG: 4-hydroxy-tetrahydrodipicolinate reductase [Gluconacetobacter diazotrophicus]|nr:4-hydroxy-tetrahydrodipicolinate reductase [Gluconacetobacter diazotrophicus]
MRIGVAGLDGRVGRLLAASVAATNGLEFVGGTVRRGIDPSASRFGSIAALAAGCDVVIDFTAAAAVAEHAARLADSGVRWVLGTTGLDAAGEAALRRAAGTIPVLRAANFAPGVVLMVELARRMAAALPADRFDAEIHEMHHRDKRDAPSGTALAIGRAVAEGRGHDLDAVRDEARRGQCGPRRPGAIGFAVSRGGHVVGEHALSFTANDEQISLAHRAFDRAVFAEGALLGARWLGAPERPPGLYGMEDVLGLRSAAPG